ncbi:hypothetical protein ACLOJK_019248 [Asimina triloba]
MGLPIGAVTEHEGEGGCYSDGEEMVMGFMVSNHGCHWRRRGSRRLYHYFHGDGVAGSVQHRQDLNRVIVVMLLIDLDLLIGALIFRI